MFGIEILIFILIFITMLLFIFGIYSYIGYRKGRWELSKRIKEMEEGIRSEQRLDIFYIIRNHLLNTVRRLGYLVKPKSEGELSPLRKTFLKAGYRRENAIIIFFGVKTSLAIMFPLLFFLVKLLTSMAIPSFYFFLIPVILIMIGFYLPNFWLQMKIAKRKEKIQEGLPDALDLMVVCVEAGTGLDAAINRVGEEMKLSNKVLSEEFRQMGMELRAGKDRRDALKNLALRVDLEDISSLVTLLIQTERFGTSLAQALRIHSDSMRTKRYQRAEEIAAKLPVKLVFPLILFIFPALFVTILGPAVIKIFRALLPTLPGR
jgi:tight adherence protein C